MIAPEVAQSLRQDMTMEHGAIFQYIVHAAQLRDTRLADQVKRVAREEMWHFEWLAEALRERGADPVLDRADVFLSPSILASLRADVDTEQLALDHYAATLGTIGDSDPELTALIERIIDDERHHRAHFERLADVVDGSGEAAFAPTPATVPEDLAVIGPTIGTEYLTILQYLLNKYGCGDCEQGETFFEFAVDEMRHMSWAAGYLPGLADPVPPPVPFDRARLVHSVAEAREAAGQLEGLASGFYAEKAPQAREPRLREDLERAGRQHAYHRDRLEGPG
jgi:bacterioferritin